MRDSFDDADPLFQRFVVFWAARTKKIKAKHILVLFGLSVVLYALWSVQNGLLGGVSHESERFSSAYGTENKHTDAYRWLDNARDALLNDSLLAARHERRWNLGRAIVVAGASLVEPDRESVVVPCAQFYYGASESQLQEYRSLVNAAHDFLEANDGHVPCVCAPQLGASVRYMAIYAAKKGGAAEQKGGGAAERDNDDIAAQLDELDHDDKPSRIVHAIELVDHDREAYDALDTATLEQRKIPLAIVHANQNYRYNEPRGTFALLRRTKLRITLRDSRCHSVTLRLTGELAQCAQECLDLMDGVDVRERARRQWKNAGIQLNASFFEAEARGTTRTTPLVSSHLGEL